MQESFSTHPRTSRMSELYQEHLLLGASFAEGAVPVSYANEEPPRPDGAYLCDLTHAQTLLFAGPTAPNFAQAAFAGAELKCGDCAFQAVLTGDGSLTDVPLLARTGTQEYVVISESPRREVLAAWLSFLAEVSQDGVQAFPELETQDVSGSHVILAVGGAKAAAILADYTPASKLPRAGQVASCMLDNIACIVCNVPIKAAGEHLYLLFVPPARARALWRSLLSFCEMSPCGSKRFSAILDERLIWHERLSQADVLKFGAQELQAQGLVRNTADFVGARGLLAQ